MWFEVCKCFITNQSEAEKTKLENPQQMKQENSILSFHAPHLLFERRDEGSALGFLQYPFGALDTRRTQSEAILHVYLCMLVYSHVLSIWHESNNNQISTQ